MSLSFRRKRRGLHVRLTTLVVSACTMVALLALMAQAASAYVPCPSGETRTGGIRFANVWGSTRENARGVTLCWGLVRPITTAGYLQIIDLTDGAKLRLQTIWDNSGPRGLINQPLTRYWKKTPAEWYSFIKEERAVEDEYTFPPKAQLFSTTNATFFTETNNSTSTTLPFPFFGYLEKHSLGVSYIRGLAGIDLDYEAPKKVFMIGDPYQAERVQAARVGSFPTYYPEPIPEEEEEEWLFIESIMHAGGIPEVEDTMEAAVGFTPEYRVGERVRRNYLGTYGNIVYIFTTKVSYTNEEMRSIMQEIQPGMEVIQMDGGGSAAFYSEYREFESPLHRKVPNVLAVYTAR
jgi:hypothetical protein